MGETKQGHAAYKKGKITIIVLADFGRTSEYEEEELKTVDKFLKGKDFEKEPGQNWPTNI